MKLLCIAALAATGTLWSQVGMERSARSGGYPETWPAGPSKDSVPSWAAPGRIRFARWDGGRIETAKAMLSGWPGFNPPDPNRVDTMTNWYRPETIRFLREAGINMIWVTFSNGFSIQTEAPHQEQLRRYIDECHRQGIHVMAYESIANMFWEDMYQNVPESSTWAHIGKDGKPTPYGAGDYTKMGRVTRHMANLNNPGWRAYLRRRIDLAIDAGADGVIYDNNFSDYLLETYREIYAYGASRKRDFLLMGNFHANTYVYNRLLNCITTEDGVEPGVYAEGNLARLRSARDRSMLMPLDGGYLVNNIGLFRIHEALSQGWKPAMIEDGHREVGVRETTPMSAARHKLALAEAMMFGVSMELFVEGGFAHGLATQDPATRGIWDAIGQYNRFFADNEEYYAGAKSLAPVAIVLDDRTSEVNLLNSLAARGVLFDVWYDTDISAAILARYRAVVVPGKPALRENARTALEAYSVRGKLLRYEKLPPVDELAKTLAASARGAVTVDAPKGVLCNVATQSVAGKSRMLVHVLNYTSKPAADVKVTCDRRFASVRLLSPDSNRASARVLPADKGMRVQIPEIGVYSVLVFE